MAKNCYNKKSSLNIIGVCYETHIHFYIHNINGSIEQYQYFIKTDISNFYSSILNVCSQRNDIINKALQQWHPEKIDELIAILHEEGNLEQLKPSLIESDFWKAGTYKLYLDIQYNTSKILTTEFQFSISDASEHAIKNNTQAILLCQIYKQSNLPCPYRFEFVDTEISQIFHVQ